MMRQNKRQCLISCFAPQNMVPTLPMIQFDSQKAWFRIQVFYTSSTYSSLKLMRSGLKMSDNFMCF